MRRQTEEYVNEAFGEIMKRIKDRMMSPSKNKASNDKMSDHVKTYVDHMGVKKPRRDALTDDEVMKERKEMLKVLKEVTKALAAAKTKKGNKYFDIKPTERPDIDVHEDYVSFSILFQLTTAYRNEAVAEYADEAWHEMSTELWPVIDVALAKAPGFKKSKGDWGFSYVSMDGATTDMAVNVEADHKWRDVFLSGLVFWLKPKDDKK